MLSQYENINRLLGPTHHGTHTGDFCEVLFRDFLRKFLPPSLSADKGFFYGRATIEGKDTHCPEIDILIHDSQQYRPIFRMGDFVIVQPQAVVGMIQMKRTLSDKPLRAGIKNIVMAKQHLLNVLWKDKPMGWLDWAIPPRVFTAVVGFADETMNKIKLYQRLLLKWSIEHRAYNRPNMIETNMYVLPSFVGSLRKQFMLGDADGNYLNERYFLYQSYFNEANTCVQAFLAKMNRVIGGERYRMPPFAFPTDMKPQESFHVLQVTRIAGNADGTITLWRNEGCKGTFRKEAVGDWPAHYTCDASSHFSPMDPPNPYMLGPLYIKHDSGVERYELIPPWEKATSGPKRKRQKPG